MQSLPSIRLLLWRLWQHVSPRRRMQFCILLLLMILASFAEVVSIGAVLPFLGALAAPERVYEHHLAKPIIAAMNITEPRQLLLPVTVAFVVAALVSGAMRLIMLWVQTRLSYAVGADFGISIYRRTLYQPYSVHISRNSSEVIAGISRKAGSMVYYTVWPVLNILSSVAMLVTIMGILIFIDPVVTLIAFAGCGGIYALMIGITRKRLARYSRRISHEQNQVLKALQEGLGGIRDVLIDGTQTTYCNIYRKADLPLRHAESNVQIISLTPRYAIESIGIVLIAALAYSLVGRAGGIASAIPVMGALALGAQRMLPMLQQVYSSWINLRGGQASLVDTLSLLDQPMPAHADIPSAAPIPFAHDISLQGLAFRYTPHSPWVLEGLDLRLPKGSRTGFVGSTGSGKSTLLDIIMGLLYPTKGSVRVDGVPITVQNLRGWQAHIAHVPQSIFLADASITENIAFGVPLEQIDHDRVRQAAQKAEIAQTIESWELQYGTLVGERGVRLSGGQRQRIGIARALYKQADVIVFDEATSALDDDTEVAVMRSIENLGEELTILIVAHRLTTLKICGHVIELSNGKVQRSGTYEEMVGANV